MESFVRAVRLLFNNFIGYDGILLIFAFLTFGVFMKTRGFRKSLINNCETAKNGDIEAIRKNAQDTSRSYSLFLALISVFPLLGMLGTVLGLLGLDMAAGEMENIKNNFFMALTSTGWGIIFSVFFKLLSAWFLDDVDSLTESAKRISEEES